MTSLNSIKNNPLNVASIKKAFTFKEPRPVKPRVVVKPQPETKEEVKTSTEQRKRVVKDVETGN